MFWTQFGGVLLAALASRTDLKPIARKVWLAGARHQLSYGEYVLPGH